MGLDALVVIGGDGIARHRVTSSSRRGIPIVGVPKTIDNDIVGTTNCFGFDTAVAFATDAIDRLHTTAEAHKRIMVVEVMGRYAGWIALYAGVAGGADAILIPEIPFDIDVVAAAAPRARQLGREVQHRRRRGRARIRRAGRSSLLEEAHAGFAERLGGIGAQVCAALARRRRGRRRDRSCSATCSAAARRRASIACSRRASAARRWSSPSRVSSERWSRSHPPDIVARRLDDVVGKTKTVPMDFDLLPTAKALGVTFGD